MVSTTSISPPYTGRKLIAPVWHTVMLVGIFLGVTIAGALFQRHAQSAPDVPRQHPNVVPLYLSVIAAEWFLMYGVWAGIKTYSVGLRDLIGGRWKSAKDFVIDLALAMVVWLLWIGLQVGVSRMVPSHAKLVSSLFPESILEVVLWIACSLSAGFCEEVTFRGYFQKQFEAMTGSAAAGVILKESSSGFHTAIRGSPRSS